MGQELSWPVRGNIDLSSSFCDFRVGHFHGGIDIRTGGVEGREVYSPVDGFIWRIRYSYSGYGKSLYLKDSSGNIYVFGHLSRLADRFERVVKADQYRTKKYAIDQYFGHDSLVIRRGELIAFSGQSGAGPPHLHFEKLIVGFNFALGKGREGDVATLSRFGEAYGFTVQTVVPVTNGGEVISSSQIRYSLAEGDVERVAKFLGRSYRLTGPVIPGDGRGRLIGIPTANIDIWVERALPKAGVYACTAQALGQKWNAVANIGYRPTFESAPVLPRVEAHLLDFKGDLYAETISLDFVQRLRDERRFDSAEDLVTQIHKDIATARDLLLKSE